MDLCFFPPLWLSTFFFTFVDLSYTPAVLVLHRRLHTVCVMALHCYFPTLVHAHTLGDNVARFPSTYMY